MPHIHQEKKLNPEQEKAVHFGQGPLLIIAGAGTGKTTVVTERIKHLITANLAKPQEILALTFTEKAAREMEERVDIAMPYGYTQMWISTFHSFCDRILRAEAIHIGLNPGYRLLSDADATLLVRQHLFEMELDYFRPLGNPHKFIGGMLQHFSRLKDEDVSPVQYLDWMRGRNENNPSFTFPLSKGRRGGVRNEEEFLENKKYQELARAYAYYEKLKIKEGLVDFADLIANTLALFRQRKNVLKKYREQFKFVLVDEFQDTNVAQYELIKLLAPPEKPNLTVVGDDNQSIYKFRGAAVSNILSFQGDYKKAKQIILNQNYRSYQHILDSAYRLIKHNDPDTLEAKLGISKKLVSARKSAQKLQVGYFHEDRVENEAERVTKEIKKLVAGSKLTEETYTWKDFAILIRANNHAEPFVRAFSRLGIPYQFLGPGQLYRQPEIKELIAYLSVLCDPGNDVALFKVLSMSYFDLSIRDLTILTAFAKKHLLTLFETCEVVAGKRQLENVRLPLIAKETQGKLEKIINLIDRHLTLIPKESAGQILFYFLQDSGLLSHILEYREPIDELQAENITKFFNKLKTYEIEHEDASVAAVLDWILLAMELGESPLSTDTDWTENDAVNILTVHSAKGLEFPVVFLVNLVSQRFPSLERREQIPIPDELIKEILPEGDFHLEEERRLFYVGMTRACDRLYLTAADFYGEGRREKKISPFVVEAVGEEAVAAVGTAPAKQLTLLDWQKQKSTPEPQKRSITVDYLSYSQIETFRTCPLHYKLHHILKIPTSPSAALSFGTSVHGALKDFYSLFKSGQKVTRKLLLFLLEQHWQPEGYTSRRYEREMLARGRRYLTHYFDKEFDLQKKPLLLEESFTIPVKSAGRTLKIGGRIDRIDELPDGRIEIIDYKTGRLPTKREIDANLQLSMYALAATRIPLPPFARKPEDVVLSLYYFDSQEKISLTKTAAELEAAITQIMAVRDEIETSDFCCKGGKLCVNCEYKLFCSSTRE